MGTFYLFVVLIFSSAVFVESVRAASLAEDCKCIRAKNQYWIDYPQVKAQNIDPVYHYETSGQGNTFKCELCETAPVLQTNEKCNCEEAQNLYISTYSVMTTNSMAFSNWKLSLFSHVTWAGKVWRCDICLDALAVGLCDSKGYLTINSGQYVNATLSPSISFSSAFSVEAWVMMPSFSSSPSVFFGDSSIWGFGIGNKQLFFRLNGEMNQGTGIPDELLQDGKWTHFAFSLTTTGYTFYINGISMGVRSHNNIFPFNSSSTIRISGSQFSLSPFVGSLDNVRIYNSSRTPSEIATSITSTISKRMPNLVLSLSFNSDLRQITSSSFDTFAVAIGATITNGPRFKERDVCASSTCFINYDTITSVCGTCTTGCPASCTNNCNCTSPQCCVDGKCSSECKIEGEMCNKDEECKQGLCCGSSGVCSSRCSFPFSSCTSSSSCISTSCSGGTCSGLLSALTGKYGSDCSSNSACQSAACIGNTCGCVEDGDCSAGSFCSATKQCIAKKKVGIPCSANNECESIKCQSGNCACSQDNQCGYLEACNNACGVSSCVSLPCPSGFIGTVGQSCIVNECETVARSYQTDTLLVLTTISGTSITSSTSGFFISLWARPDSPGSEFVLVQSGAENPTWRFALRNNCLNFFVGGNWAHAETCVSIAPGFNFYSLSLNANTSKIQFTTNAKTMEYTLSSSSIVTKFPLKIFTTGSSNLVDQFLFAHSSSGATNVIASITFDTQNTWGTSNYTNIPALFKAMGTGSISNIVPPFHPRVGGCALLATCEQQYPNPPTCSACPNGFIGSGTTTCTENQGYVATQAELSEPADHLWHLWGTGNDVGTEDSINLVATGTGYQSCQGILDEDATGSNRLSAYTAVLKSGVSLSATGDFDISTSSSFSVSLLFRIVTVTGSTPIVSFEGNPALGASSLDLILRFASSVVYLESNGVLLGQISSTSTNWNHVVFGFKSGRAFFVFNGQSVTLANWGESLGKTTVGHVATLTIGPGGTTNGYVSELAVWCSYALTYEDIRSLYNTFSSTKFAYQLAVDIQYEIPKCPEGTIASVTSITAVGGTNNYNYFVNGAAWTGAVQLPVGSVVMYSVTDSVTQCSVTNNRTLPNPPSIITTTPRFINALCNGLAGTASISGTTGGTSPYTYTWTSNSTSSSKTGSSVSLLAGGYILTIRDRNQCSRNYTGEITQPTVLEMSATHEDAVCNAANGTAQATVTGGTQPYRMAWVKNNVAESSSALLIFPKAGTYTPTAYDANNCTATSQQFTVQQPTAIVISFSIQKSSCNTNGSVNATVTGGTPPYTLAWGNNVDASLRSEYKLPSVPTGSYWLTVTDNNSCVVSREAKVIPYEISISNPGRTNVTCPGGQDGRLSITPGGSLSPFTYVWGDGTTLNTLIDLSVGTYTVTINDFYNCPKTFNVPVYLARPEIESTFDIKGPCLTVNDASVAASPRGGAGVDYYSYTWYNSGRSVVSTLQSPTGIVGGEYLVNITDSFCWKNFSVSIPIYEPLVVVPDRTEDPGCHNSNDGIVSVIASGGSNAVYTYLWKVPGNSTVISNTNAANVLKFGTYEVSVSTSGYPTCVNRKNITLANPEQLTVSFTDTPVTCNGARNGAFTATVVGGNSTSYSVTWTLPNNSITTTSTPSTLSGLSGGSHSYIILDANGCQITGSHTVNEPVAITANLMPLPLCLNSSDATISVTQLQGGLSTYFYKWYAAGSNSIISQANVAKNLIPGNYLVTISSGICSFNFSTTVPSTAPLSGTVTVTNPKCATSTNGGTSVLMAGGNGGAYQYSWRNSQGAQISSASSASNLGDGSYSLQVFSSSFSSCVFERSVVLTSPNPLVATVVDVPVTCYGAKNGKIHLTVQGGNSTTSYRVQWNMPNGTTVTINNSGDLVGLHGGIYLYTVIDANGCSYSHNHTLYEPNAIEADIRVSQPCLASNDAEVTIASVVGGTGNYSFTWKKDNVAFAYSRNISQIVGGNYSVTIGNGTCYSEFPVTVPLTTPLSASVFTRDPLCTGNSNGNIFVEPSGGAPGGYSYTWIFFNGSSIVASSRLGALASGSYDVQIAAINNPQCKLKKRAILSDPALLTTNPSGSRVSCFGVYDGSINAGVGGGNSTSYLVEWRYPNGTISTSGRMLSGLGGGTYSYTVTDANSCKVSGSYSIVEPAQISATIFSNKPATCNAGSDGALYVNATGDLPLAYTWLKYTGPVASVYAYDISYLTSITAGTYALVVESGSCNASFTYTVTEPTAINITTSKVAPTCAASGSLTVNVTGGSPSYVVTLRNSSGNTKPVNNGFIGSLPQDFYTVIVQDAKMCEQTAEVALVQPSNITIATFSQNITCFGAKNGRLEIVANNGVPPYTYHWEHNASLTATILDNLSPGTYRVVVRDSSASCSVAQSTIRITSPTPINSTFSFVVPSCSSCSDGIATANVTGGTPPYTYSWGSNTLIGRAQDYQFNITDAASCTFGISVALPASICGDNKVTGAEQCDPPGVDCCDAFCNYIPASVQKVCRASVSQCDVVEYCSGSNASCPGDSFAPLDTPCSLNCSLTSTCVAGTCASKEPFDCSGGYCNYSLNVCACTNTSMNYPYCLSSCPENTYGPLCQHSCSCVQGTCIDGPFGNGTCMCNPEWYGVNCSITRAPITQQAIFAVNALSFSVSFDIDTNLGGQALNMPFFCSAVIAPITLVLLDSASSCIWYTARTLTVLNEGMSSIRVNSPVVIRNDTIFAAPGSIAAAIGALTLAAPTNPISPTISISGPNTVGSCDGITLSPSIQGSVSKSIVVNWTVTATTSDTSSLLTYLATYSQVVLTVPNTMLVAGNTYTFHLNITNVFAKSGSAQHMVLKSVYNVPTISISGPTLITTYAPQSLTLQGSVVIPTSDECKPSASLSWQWTVVQSGTGNAVTLSSSVSTKKNLVIPANTLTSGFTYTATLLGSYATLVGLNNTASVTISVTRSELVASISGGNIRSNSVTLPLIVNATASTDPDSGSNSQLTFTWTCATSAGVCLDSNNAPLTLVSTPTLVFPQYTLLASESYIFTLSLSASDRRTANTSVRIQVVTEVPPDVRIEKLASTLISSSSKLELKGLVNPTNNITYLWTESTGKLDLNNRNNLLTSRTNINLVIKPNVLLPGEKYTFLLQATNSNGTGIAGVDVAVSSLPHGGSCVVDPPAGTAVSTNFIISCRGWDSDSALTYIYSYKLGNTEVTLRTQVAESLTTNLPLPSNGTNIPIFVRISNFYNASTTITLNATVTLTVTNPSETNEFVKDAILQVTSNLNQYGDSDASIQSLVALSSVLQATPFGDNATANAETVNLHQEIFSVFANVASGITESPAVIEQLSGNIAILSQSSSQWDDSAKTLLVDTLHTFTKSSSSVSNQGLESLLTGVSNIFQSNPATTGNSQTTRSLFSRSKRNANDSPLGNNPEMYSKLRDSVTYLSNNLLSNMVCGQDNTEIFTSNLQIMTGKVPREESINASINVNGLTVVLPLSDNTFAGINCLDSKVAMQPTELYADSSSDFISLVATITVGSEGQDLDVNHLQQPIAMVFPIYNFTTSCNETSNCTASCQFLNEFNNTWDTTGCSVYASNLTHVVCHCTHLTSFSVHFENSLKPLEEAGDKIANPSFSGLLKRPAPIILVACVFALYIVAMISAIKYDRFRGFYDEEFPENFNDPTSVTLSSSSSLPSPLVSPTKSQKYTLDSSNSFNLDSSSDSISRSPSISDPMVLHKDDLDYDSSSTTSSVGRKMGRRSVRGTVRGSVNIKEKLKMQEEERIKKVESGAHAQALDQGFNESLDKVDEVYGVQVKQYQQKEKKKLSRFQKFKLEASIRFKTNHRYFRIFFRKTGDPFSRARRLTVLLNVIITCLACNAIFYKARNTDEHISFVTRLLIAIWSSLLITPINLLVYLLLSKATWRFPAMQEIPMDEFSSIERKTSIAEPDPFKPSRQLRKEQDEYNRLKEKHDALEAKAAEMTMDEALEMGAMQRGRLVELVAEYKTDLEWLHERITKRHDEEFEKYRNPPPPGRFDQLISTFTGDWPWYCSIIGYVLSFLVCVFSTYIVLIFANDFSRAALNGWLLSSGLAIAQDILLNQPIASVLGAVFGVFLGAFVNRAVTAITDLIKGT